MDLYDYSGTEGPHTKTNSNKTKPHIMNNLDVMEIVQLSIAPVGIIGNFTVIVVFLSHRKLRRKIPNRFIVNQVRIVKYALLYFMSFSFSTFAR